MKTILAAAALLFGLFGAGLAPPAVAAEFDSNRPGGDYRNFILGNPDPQACQAQCDQEGQCVAWTFVKPGIQGPQARCWLKQTVPARRADSCCVSGTRTAARPPAAGTEPGVNRPGGDYRSFNQSGSDPQECRAACAAEGACRSWTYVLPGIQGPAARCWLKGGVPQARPDACCTSGVKTAAAPPPPPPQANACVPACEQRCRQRGRPGGSYNGGLCLLGVPEESACTCN